MACRILGCHPNTLRVWGKRRVIDFIRITETGKYRWDVDGLIEREKARLERKQATFKSMVR
jgi:hypothetical protein